MDDPIEARLRLVVREENQALQQTLDAILRRLERRRVEPTFITTGQAAKLAHVAPDTIRSWVRSGQVRGHRSGHKWLISRGDLIAKLRGDSLGAVEAAVTRELRVIKLETPAPGDEDGE